jgi:NADPH:quinone reductase-like Zn-dependent oxidoreductase
LLALNPTDWKHIQFVDQECTVGCDIAGIVDEVGSAVTKPWKKGDRVCGFVHGGNEVHGEDGAFGEFATGKGDLLMRIPDSMSFEDAATLGVGVITVGQGLYQEMGLPFPDGSQGSANGKPILIYGGSSATGMAGIQFAKLSGFTVITTCSPRNFEKVEEFGADHVFDYSSPTCAEDIRKLTNNKLEYAWDTISEGSAPKICAEALGDSGDLKYGAILSVKDFPRKDVKQTYSLGYTVVGERFQWRTTSFEAKPQDFEFGVKFTTIAEKLLADGKIRPPSKEVRDGGLEAIFGGLDDLKEGRVSGTKIVYKIDAL